MRRFLVFLVLSLAATPAAGVELFPGDVVVLESTNDSVVRVRPSAYVEGNPAANQVVITQGNLIANPYDVAIGDGVLYVTDRSNESIVSVNPDTSAQSNVPLDPIFNIRPRGIAIDSGGQLLVGDQNSFALLQINPDTGAAATLTPNIFLNTPGGEIYISESGQGLQLIEPGQQTATPVAGSFVSGRGLVVDKVTGDLYSSSSTEISRFDPDTYDPGNADANRDVVFDDDATDVGLLSGGDLVATAVGNADLFQIDPDTQMGSTVADGGNLLIPTGLAVVLALEPGAATLVLVAALSLVALVKRQQRHTAGASVR